MTAYQTVPLPVEARQWDGTVSSYNALREWLGAERLTHRTFHTRWELLVHRDHGTAILAPYDWIITYPDGTLSVCDRAAFATRYVLGGAGTP